MTSKLLLVEDDVKLAKLTADFLEQNGLTVSVANNCEQAKTQFSEGQPDLILLDLNLPDGDGLALCQYFRNEYKGPILMLTARDSNLEEVIGLDSGADDYIRKPAEPTVLLARIRSFLRLAQRHGRSSETFEFGRLSIRPASQQVFWANQEITMTSMEFMLLSALAECAGEIVTRDELHQRTRGIEYDGLDRTVDVRISRLRKKLADYGEHPKKIRTIRGKGYLFVADAWA